MENNFKKLREITKAQKDPLFRTFEGALFESTGWFLETETTPIVTEISAPIVIAPAPAALVVKKPVIVDLDHKYLSEVLFVGDSYIESGDDLLGKMISAMKLFGSEFHRFKMDEQLEEITDLAMNLEKPSLETQNLLNAIKENRPKVVVSLGATVTNILLGKREKLSTIHGQFFEKSIGDCVYALMPIFHPDFLIINPNMKRTAWTDLQKVMERVGKI